MPLPAKTTFVTFDVYGTLIDWESGIWDAFAAEAARDGFTIERDEVIPLFHEIARQIEGGSYELYAEVLRRTAVEISKRLGWPLEPSRSGFLPDSVQHWMLFRETRTQLEKLAKKYRLGLISNIDDKLLGQTRRHIPIDFDLVVTAQQVRSYKPDLAHFNECARRIGGKKGWVHVASSYYHDVEPCVKAKIPVIWVNRHKETLDAGPAQADRRGPEPARSGQAPGRRLGLRARDRRPRGRDRRREPRLAHDRHGGAQRRGGVRDRLAGVPDELELLPALLEQSRFRFSGLLATHGDWDHLLGRLAFPGAALGVAETTAARLSAPGCGPASAARLRRAPLRRAPGATGARLGRGAAGARLLRPGRERAGASPGRRTHRRRDGDLDPVGEDPGLRRLPLAGRDPHAGGLARRLPGDAGRLEPLVEQADYVVPGHGGPLERPAARALLREDRDYLEALRERRPAASALPRSRRDAEQRRLHAANVARLREGDAP